MKILLLGKNGMLGGQFETQLNKLGGNYEVFSLGRDDLDVTKFRALKKTFEALLPDVVINCTGYTNVDEAEFQKKEAFALNADAPKSIAQLCNKHGAVLIHFSTDYVFDGRKVPPDGYTENSVCNPLGAYGETKWKGEEFIQKEMVKHFIIRTSWLYGPRPDQDGHLRMRGGNFVDTMLRLGREVLSGDRDVLNVVGDQFGSPTYTFDLVEAIVKNFIICSPENLPEFGIYHLTNDDFCTWHEFAVRIFELSEMKIKVGAITTKDYPTPAQRPKNSILQNTKLSKPRNWSDALADYLYKFNK